MRLRLTVRRHSFPETSIIWVVDSIPSPTIAELLESVNESIPIESEEWGFEDYVVELKGNDGINYECLHYQQVGKVMKEEDEVIIRPLLTQDIRTRKRSGRHQISADGYRLYDGLAYGKTLTKALADRPEIRIPPRKKRRVTYHNDEDEDDQYGHGNVAALEEKFSEHGDSNKQLVLHADFDDDDEDDDEDFAPDEDPEADLASERSEKDSDADEDSEGSRDDGGEEDDIQLEDNTAPLSAEDNQTLDGIPDEATRAKIRKLHSAFPTSAMAVCNFILVGTEGDIGEAYEAMVQGFVAVKPKSAIAGISEEAKALFVPKTRSKAKEMSKATSENDDQPGLETLSVLNIRSNAKRPFRSISESQKDPNMDKLPLPTMRALAESEPTDEDEEEEEDDQRQDIDSKTKYYDQNGFPPGSIKAGKLTSFGSELENGSSQLIRRHSDIADSRKSLRSHVDPTLPGGLSSTPLIDQQELEDDEGGGTSSEDSDDEGNEASSEDSSDDSSDDSSAAEDEASSGPDSNDSDSESSDSDAPQNMEASIRVSLSSSSDIDSSSDSSSEDGAPEEASSRLTLKAATSNLASSPPSSSIAEPVTKQAYSPPCKGLVATQKRNQRRRNGHMLRRCRENGILPKDTTPSEFRRLGGINMMTPREEALAALNRLRDLNPILHDEERLTDESLAKADDFEQRRKALLASLAAGGIEVAQASTEPLTALVQQENSNEIVAKEVSAAVVAKSQPLANGSSTSYGCLPELSQITIIDPVIPAQSARTSPAPEITANEHPTPPSQPPPDSAKSTQNASERRAKLDVSAGRRLLFGAWGIRVPKTKKDEEIIRNSLMENVRPVKAPRAARSLSGNDNEDYVEEDPEAWRKTIKYRAVECVQEGIELSEPPFPFLQRWDPQQQKPWSKKGGKRKTDQVDQSDYSEDARVSKKQKQRKGNRSYQEEQDYLDESYQPSHEKDSFSTNYDDLSHLTGPGNEDEGEISQQLLNAAQAPVEAASQDQLEEDLAPLPENPASLPDLENAQAQVGMTIAYKALECSPETRWQPQMSNYRTAIVVAIQGNGELHLTLAKRDRKETTLDEDTGERIYSKFEMANDDLEDDGMVYLMFNQLCEPKIVQEAPADLNNDAAIDDSQEIAFPSTTPSYEEATQQAQEPQFSHVTESSLHSNPQHPEHLDDDVPDTSIQFDAQVPEMFDDNVIGAPSHFKTLGLGQLHNTDKIHQAQPPYESERDANIVSRQFCSDSHGTEPMTPSAQGIDTTFDADALPTVVSNEARQRISYLIKDAGFRSSVPSSVTRGMRPDNMETPGDDVVFEKLMQVTKPRSTQSYSPTYNDFGSSSPIGKLVASPYHFENLKEPSISPASPIRSSWITVEESPSSLPVPSQVKGPELHDSQEWETDSEDQSSSPPTRNQLKPDSIEPQTRKRVPIANAQLVWEQFAGTKSQTSSPGDTFKPPMELEDGLHGDQEVIVSYPKLSNEFSITSQIADHGRQPDFDFDDSAVLNMGTTVVPLTTTTNSSPIREIEEEVTSRRMSIDDNGDIQSASLEPGLEEQRLPSKSLISARIEVLLNSPTRRATTFKRSPKAQKAPSLKKVIEKPPPQDIGSSDDEFPTIEEVLSQRPPKDEGRVFVGPEEPKRTDEEKQTARNSRFDSTSEDSEISDSCSSPNHPRPSQPRFSSNQVSEITSIKSRDSPQPAPQPRPSRTLMPPSSQIINLTSSSSDDEKSDELKEPETIALDSSDDDRSKSFRSYDLDDGDEERSWGAMTSSSAGTGDKKLTGNKLRNSSQVSVNMQNRRKPGSRNQL